MTSGNIKNRRMEGGSKKEKGKEKLKRAETRSGRGKGKRKKIESRI
jgi:hypothetical protein